MSEYQWMFLRHLYASVEKRLGEDGLDALAQGLWSYGYYRGQAIRDLPGTIADGRDALSLLRHWDSGDFALAADSGEVHVSGTPARATITLPSAPGAAYYAKMGGAPALALHWQQMLLGLAAGYDEKACAVEAEHAAADPCSPWSVTFTFVGAAPDGVSELPDLFEKTADYIRTARRSTGLIAALQFHSSRALIDRFDASAEEAVREASYAFGNERGLALRERHLANGIPINLKTMGQTLRERDPIDAIFAIRGESYVSEGLSHFDCTYCPLAEVWAEEGTEGLALGYLFDMELHRGLLEGFHPGAIVRWDALKTRGDSICRFRFSIPELVTQEERASLDAGRSPGRRPG